MPVTLVSGAEASTTNVDNNVRDMLPVTELEPDAAPLTHLLNKMGSKPAKNPKVEWLEDELKSRVTSLSASATSVATAFGVSADIFTVGDVVNFTPQGFSVLVTATAAGAITGTAIGTQASAASAGSELFIVANANAEGSSLTEIKITQIVPVYNYCQIVQEPFGVTATEDATEHYSGDELNRLRKRHGIMHARQLEHINFFGIRSLQGANQRTAGGIDYYVSTNVTALTSMTNAQWETFLGTGFRYGSREKWAFCSPKAATAINLYAANNIRVVNDRASTYGVSVKQYLSHHGTVNIVEHRDWSDSTIYGGYLFLVDMDAIRARPLRPTKMQANVHAPDYDGFKDRWISEYSLAVQHERRFGMLTGLTGAIA